MGSISSPDGPSISGYTQIMIDDEVSSTQSAYNTALSQFNNAKSDYNAKVAAANTALTNYNNTGYTVDSAEAELQAAKDYRDAVYADPNSTQEEKDAADQAVADAQANYDNVFSLYTALTDAISDLNTSKTAYQSATNAMQTAATNYGTALARRQMFTDSTASGVISSEISGLSGSLAAEGFEGMSAAEYATLQNAEGSVTSARDDLLNAFNAYRYLEWQIANKRAQIISAYADEEYAYFNYQKNTNDSTTYDTWQASIAARSALESELTSLLNQRATTTSTLDSAISTYKAAYNAVDDTILSAISSARTQAENWSSFVDGERTAAESLLNSMYNAALNQDTATRDQHYVTYPSDSTSATDDQLAGVRSSYTATIDTILSSGSGATLSGIPTLPSARNRILSLSELMRLISQVQLMLDELSREITQADYRINSFRREIAQSQVDLFVRSRIAEDASAADIYAADNEYNQQVEEDNKKNFVDTIGLYNACREQFNAINNLIGTINEEIDQQNQATKNLVDAANTIAPEISNAINSAQRNKPETTNTLDYNAQDADTPTPSDQSTPDPIGYPPDIPHYEFLEPLPEPPSFDVLASPPVFPSESEIAALNQSITELARHIAPFKERVQKMLGQIYAGTEDGYELLELRPFYLRETIPVRDSLLKSEIDGFFSFIFAFSTQINAMAMGERSRKEEEQDSALLKRIDELVFTPIFAETSDARDITTSVGGGFGFTTADTKAKPSQIASLVNQLARASEFAQVFSKSIERVGIVAGLQAAGVTPESSKNTSVFGIPINELLQEKGVDLIKVIEAQSNQALAEAFIAQLSRAAQDVGILQQNATEILALSSLSKGLSSEELKEALAGLIALQQLLLLLLAALLGSSLGISPQEITSSFGGVTAEKELAELFQNIGLPEEKARAIAGALGGRTESLIALLQGLGLGSDVQVALLLLLGASESGVSLTQGIPGGEAFLRTVLEKIAAAGIDIPTTMKPSALLELLKSGTVTIEKAINTLIERAEHSGIAIPEEVRSQDLIERLKGGDKAAEKALKSLAEKAEKAGITLPVDIQSPEFIKQIVHKLEIQADESQREIIQRDILRAERRNDRIAEKQTAQPKQSADSIQKQFERILEDSSSAFQELGRNVSTGFTSQSVEQQLGLDSSTPPVISARDIIDQARSDFRKLPIETQKRIIDAAQQQPHLKSLTSEVSDEDKAILIASIALGTMTPQDASALLRLLIAQAAVKTGLEAGDTANAIIQRLFQRSEEETRRIEETQRHEKKTENIRQQIERPSTLPKQTREIMREAFEVVSRSFSDRRFAEKTIENMAQFFEKMTDFNDIAVNYLMDPGKIILREFSIITRSSSDKAKQSPILFGG